MEANELRKRKQQFSDAALAPSRAAYAISRDAYVEETTALQAAKQATKAEVDAVRLYQQKKRESREKHIDHLVQLARARADALELQDRKHGIVSEVEKVGHC
jgi:thioesterase domain-containing protein